MPVAAIYWAWVSASAASCSLQLTGPTPNRPRAALWALSTVLRSKESPRSAGAGQLGLGRFAAADGVASKRAIRAARIMATDFALHEVKNVLTGVPARDGLALYVHWPFCVSKCPYCDFNSHVRDSIDQDSWRKALLADLAPEAA